MSVRNKSLYLILLFLFVITAYGIYLIFKLKGKVNIGTSDIIVTSTKTAEADEPVGEAVVHEVGGNLFSPFKNLSLNVIRINNISNRPGPDDKTTLTDLEMLYKKNNNDKRLTVTLGNKVNLAEFTYKNGEGFTNDKGIVDVNTAGLKIGDWITVILSYFPLEDTDAKSRFDNYCSMARDAVCSTYPELGFGLNPVDSKVLNLVNIKDGDKIQPSQFAVRGIIRNLTLSNK